MNAVNDFSTTSVSGSLATVPSQRERFAVLIAHAGTWFGWFLAPLFVYVLKRGDSRWVEHHAMQSFLWSLLGTVLAAVTCGVAIPLFLGWHLYAAYRIHRGDDYDYPIVGDFSRGLVGLPAARRSDEIV